MAAAEARAAWQRMANRCFVQEDAKRAPKLACCPSSSSSLMYESTSGDTVNVKEQPATDFMPLNWNPANSNLPPDTKWWLQLQPNFGYQKESIFESLTPLEEEELGNRTRENVAPSPALTEDFLPCENADVDIDKNANSFLKSPQIVSTTFMRHDSETKHEELKAVKVDNQQIPKHKIDTSEYCFEGDDLVDWTVVDRLISRNPDLANFDMEPHLIHRGKTEPWWHIADKDELASLVVQKSLQHIENCDLPPPQKVHISRDPFAYLGSFDDTKIFSSSSDENLCSDRVQQGEKISTSGSIDGSHWSSGEVGQSFYDSENLCRACASSAPTEDQNGRTVASDLDPSRSQLLEALRHSQTRAREAEMAAKKAYNDKEHIVKLIFKQASHLFAYKQWLRLLQLESLYLQLKIKENQIATLLPVLPWMPLKGNQSGSDGNKEPKRKGKQQQKCRFCRYVVAFAVGLGLASAGLFLGWTLGCMLPVV